MLTVAQREILDAWRDRRAMLSATLYCLMGPGVVSMVRMSVGDSPAVLAGMMSVFTLVSAFVGGMNVAMDAVAGERERRSLLPLLLHPVSRLELLLGKWLAVALFATGGLLLNLAGFAMLFHRLPPWPLALCLLPLALLAAALELVVSTVCRGIKEAHTYLSMLIFLPMGAGMYMVFSPGAGKGWAQWLPVAGQQVQLELGMRGGEINPVRLMFLGFATLLLAAAALVGAAERLERDDVVYGG